MAKKAIHSKIIAEEATRILKPLGVVQEGRSRFWYDDQGWYCVAIEFQPSSWSKGSHLNVGVHWLWHPSDDWSFDLGYREHNHVVFEGEVQFRQAIVPMVELARGKVLHFRSRLETLPAAYAYVLGRKHWLRNSEWFLFHLAILAGLVGEVERSRRFFGKAIVNRSDVDWFLARNQCIQGYLDLLNDPGKFRCRVEQRISECRSLLRLPARTPPCLPQKGPESVPQRDATAVTWIREVIEKWTRKM